ncbi:hypothetical protein [Nostoc commune]|uniref:hypothetical protein n=1 Tax=Nostoc commune TaxID=1178 RepID=UPI0018C67D52|nr:hypothetical protein [Nostoc commune]MBG1260344.1 hypothetical protein [Nostoc commune BAE]
MEAIADEMSVFFALVYSGRVHHCCALLQTVESDVQVVQKFLDPLMTKPRHELRKQLQTA